MSVTAITSGSTQAATTTTGSGLSGMSADDFMNLLIKQLQYQDPLEPMSNEQMMQQISTIRQVQANTSITDSLGNLTTQERFGSAAALMGKHVKGTVTDADGNAYAIEGIVKSIVFTSKGDIQLELDDGSTLPLANLEEVGDATSTTQTTTKTKQPLGAALAKAIGLKRA